MKVTFLEATVPLIKAFRLNRGQLEKTSYPHAREFTSHTHVLTTLSQFHKQLQAHAKKGHCLLKGELQRELVHESRAGSTDAAVETNWLCLDVDGLPSCENVDDFLKLMPKEFQGASYLVQYSASMGVDVDKGLSAHLFFMLDKPQTPAVLKAWLQHINLATPQLREALRLSRTKNVISWPLDISVAQNDKLIYIAPPQLGHGVKDYFKGQRIQLVKGKRPKLTPNLKQVNEQTNKVETKKALNELRKAEGLEPKRDLGEKLVKGEMVGKTPDQATATEIRRDRGFVYFNLNGGDSWGYYHPEDNPEVIYNFKGEPNYLTRELLPEYYAEVQKQAKVQAETAHTRPAADGRYYFAFTNPQEDTYYRGCWDPEAERFEHLAKTKSLKRVQDYLALNNRPVPDAIEEWTMAFRFDEECRFDPEARFINTYQPSEALQNPKPSKTVPTTIKKVLQHMLADSGEVYEHFLNWLAFIVQKRQKLPTVWLWLGTQGTGKGLIFDHVLKPLVGEAYAEIVPPNSLAEKYNASLERLVFALVDEVEMGAFDQNLVESKLKMYTGNRHVPIRKMGTDIYNVENWTHFIFTANKHGPLPIPMNDRRHNVGNRQSVKLDAVMDTKGIDARLRSEVPAFAGYLLTRKVDEHAARTPLDTETRRATQHLTLDSVQEIANAVLEGNFGFFLEHWPPVEDPDLTSRIRCALFTYKEAMQEVYENRSTGNVSRDALHVLFYYIAEKVPTTPNKFTKTLAHKGIDIVPVKIRGVKVRGFKTSWRITDEHHTEYAKKVSGNVRDITSKTRRKA